MLDRENDELNISHTAREVPVSHRDENGSVKENLTIKRMVQARCVDFATRAEIMRANMIIEGQSVG